MLVHPQFDPVALAIGPLAVRWYGLMYVCAFAAFMLLGLRRTKTRPDQGWTREELDDLMFWGVIGVVVGGRLGQVLFYEPAHYLANPLEILAVWHGGMAFHGGLIGVLLVLARHARKFGRSFLEVGDFVGPLVPLGLLFGRIGNFINGELWGRPADPSLPWAMVFPQAGDGVARHPSQLYQASLEGLALFVILWLYTSRPRPVGAASGLFLLGYGSFRFIAEYFRDPDAGIFGKSDVISMGQWLSLPMIVLGLWLFTRARQRAPG
ncbi:MAG: prolipoprotein diacylglyceryl transferase [Pseudomonadota bacterium]